MSLPGLALVTPLIFAQGEKGGWFSHMSLPGLALVTPLIFAQGEKGGWFSHMSLPGLALGHSVYLFAR